jgi:nitroreductase
MKGKQKMDVRTAIKERRSIRRFKPDEVPKETIKEILEEARWSPSWGNTQPWEFFVLMGDPLERFKKGNSKLRMDERPTSPEIPMPELWPEALKKRYVGVGKSVLSSSDIAREDKAARNKYYGDMFSLFGAPCLIVSCIHSTLSREYAMLDIGLINQTICLLAHDRGLGTIMLAAAARYPHLLRSLLPIPADRTIVIGTAIGYPDGDAPVNNFERQRAPLDDLVTWVL